MNSCMNTLALRELMLDMRSKQAITRCECCYDDNYNIAIEQLFDYSPQQKGDRSNLNINANHITIP